MKGLSEEEREPRDSCWGWRQPWGGREKLFTDKPGPGAGASPPPQLLCPGGALCPTDRAQPTGHRGRQASRALGPTSGGPQPALPSSAGLGFAQSLEKDAGGQWGQTSGREEGRSHGDRRERAGGGQSITEHGELGPPRAQGSLCSLALIGGVVRQLGVRDLQVVLPGIRGAHDPVPWPGCGDTKGERGEPCPSLGPGLPGAPLSPWLHSSRRPGLEPRPQSPRCHIPMSQPPTDRLGARKQEPWGRRRGRRAEFLELLPDQRPS